METALGTFSANRLVFNSLQATTEQMLATEQGNIEADDVKLLALAFFERSLVKNDAAANTFIEFEGILNRHLSKLDLEPTIADRSFDREMSQYLIAVGNSTSEGSKSSSAKEKMLFGLARIFNSVVMTTHNF